MPLTPKNTLLLLAALCAAAPSLRAALETWTDLDGQAMKAEFFTRKGDYVFFKKEDGTRYLYPYAKLSEADRARVDARVAAAAATTAPAAAAAAEPPAAAASAAASEKSGSVADALKDKLVVLKDGSLQPCPPERLRGARYLAFYYSAHWCPPCRGFTPELVAAYAQIRAKRSDFEIVFVSGDEDAEAMKSYMSQYQMGWPAFRFERKFSPKALADSVRRKPSHERGIPNLVFMDADGKELSASYTPAGQYRGPQAVLADIQKRLGG